MQFGLCLAYEPFYYEETSCNRSSSTVSELLPFFFIFYSDLCKKPIDDDKSTSIICLDATGSILVQTWSQMKCAVQMLRTIGETSTRGLRREF